jgi:hypothetical protein
LLLPLRPAISCVLLVAGVRKVSFQAVPKGAALIAVRHWARSFCVQGGYMSVVTRKPAMVTSAPRGLPSLASALDAEKMADLALAPGFADAAVLD